MAQPSCTSRFIRPFLQLLPSYSGFSHAAILRIARSAETTRVTIDDAHRSLGRWVKYTGDVDLGLRAGQRMRVGWGGPLEYAMHSAASVRDGIALARKYAHLFSDVLQPTLEVHGRRAIIRLDNALPWPRAAADFTLATWFSTHIRSHFADAPEVECWLAHASPTDVSTYEQAFGRAKIRFHAPCYGFAFPAEYADMPLASADASMHAAHCQYLALMHTHISGKENVRGRVRELVAEALRQGHRPCADGIARKLHMSRRTLARRLEEDGTTFAAELDETRRALALQFVGERALTLKQITSLLGFSHVQGFGRAFKRWTGESPSQFRMLRDRP